MISAIQTALSGLFASSRKIEASASNIANLTTAGSLSDPDNAPYTPIQTQQTAVTVNGETAGVRADFVPKSPAFVPAYDPDSPFADEEGLIGVPNVDLGEEAVNISLAKTAYKASLSVIKTSSEMDDDLLRLFDKKA